MFHFSVKQHINIRSFVQSVRYLVFVLVDVLLAKHLSTLKSIEEDFIPGYIKIAEGEKDPRNLILAFGIARVVLIEFDPYKYLDVS